MILRTFQESRPTLYSAQTSPGNGKVCGVCGTSVLAQYRNGVPDEQQWKAAFDHLLSETDYPLIALQPTNLLPTCKFCNSDAKLAKDVLHNARKERRLSFDPWKESAFGLVQMGIDFHATGPAATITFVPNNPVVAEKMETWNAVYDIKQRVLGEFSSLGLKISDDLDLDSLTDLRLSLFKQQRKRLACMRVSPYNYWRALLYAGMRALRDDELDQVRQLFQEVYASELADCDAIFGDLLA
ncbi:hypothetical protein [Rhodoferax sp. BLA1]|uniref:hypothetical protein n=1 Tax=Rhodoferax sp. BLA1 TaxID=2576062 RepID=UPI0015D38A1D|nr:hypothetical protein [Rhodoferax sp. BLA1]